MKATSGMRKPQLLLLMSVIIKEEEGSRMIDMCRRNRVSTIMAP